MEKTPHDLDAFSMPPPYADVVLLTSDESSIRQDVIAGVERSSAIDQTALCTRQTDAPDFPARAARSAHPLARQQSGEEARLTRFTTVLVALVASLCALALVPVAQASASSGRSGLRAHRTGSITQERWHWAGPELGMSWWGLSWKIKGFRLKGTTLT